MPVGPSPFNPDYSEWYSKKRYSKNKREYKGLQAGFPKRQLKSSLTGDVYSMPEQDYNELVKHFGEHQSELSEVYSKDHKYGKIQTPADYIDYGFSDAQKKNLVTQTCAGGHIKALTYNALYKLLMVEFTNNGDVCVFFNLPANVAAELMYAAEYNTMAPPDKHGRERHMVGVQFWNLVRVRGTIHDTQYPFQYTNDMRTGKPFGRQQGIGPDGKPSKYVYEHAAPMRRAYDKKTGEEILRESVIVRAPRDSDATSSYSNNTWTEDDLDAYFNEGDYDSDLARVSADKRKKLQALYTKYMNMNYTDANTLGNELDAAGWCYHVDAADVSLDKDNRNKGSNKGKNTTYTSHV